MAFTITDFKAEVSDLAREAHFDLEIPNLPPVVSGNSRRLTTLCAAANLPVRQADVVEIRRTGTGITTPFVVGMKFSTFYATFYCDDKSEIIKTFQTWMDGMMNLKRNGKLYTIEYRQNYSTDIFLNQYDSLGKKISTYVFKEAFPQTFGPINFSWGSLNNLVLVPVSFLYTYYTVGDAPRSSIDNLSTTIQAGKNNNLSVTGFTPIAGRNIPV
jgi:hypothetical protein